MGYGSYSASNAVSNRLSKAYYTAPISETFTERNINIAMNPKGIVSRESRDSVEHPNSVAIIIALDVTGSMLNVPAEMIKNGLPTIMSNIIEKGTPDPQVLFVAIGDHECDRAPLQVGQFETSDELLDKWLTSVYPEGGGGGNAGESYLLAWYFASQHTSTDCFEKRNQKGFIFTIGDEPCLKKLPSTTLKNIMGDGQYSDYNDAELLAKAVQTYNVYHVHLKETPSGSRPETIQKWKSLIGENLIIAEKHEDIPGLIASKILQILGKGDVTIDAIKGETMIL